jgi:hypothetical protein
MVSRHMKRVGEYIDTHLGVEIPIFYDARDHQHIAHFAGISFKDASYETLRSRVVKCVMEQVSFTYVPVIVVHAGEPVPSHGDKNEAGIEFSFDRFFVAQRPDGKFNQCDWSVTDTSGIGKEGTHGAWNWKKYSGFDIPNTLKIQNGREWYTELKSLDLPQFVKEHRGDVAYLPYREETWTALQQIQQVIDRAREQLRKLLSSKKGLSQLETKGSMLLGSGTEEP